MSDSEIPMPRPGKIIEHEQFRILGIEVNRLTAEVEHLRAALREIAHMEPGSRGAYTKYARAVAVAQRALDASHRS